MPAYSTTGTAALQYPPMVEIKLMPWGDDLIKFKKCLIKGVSVNYAPSGLPSFFAGTKQPTMIQLEIQLIETEIQTAKDYGFKPGDRPDGLEQFKDALATGAEKMGLGDVVNTVNNAKNKVFNGISSGAEAGAANYKAGVARND